MEMKVRQEKQEKGSKERPRDRCPWDEGEFQGRSIDLGGSVFRSVRSGRRVEG